MEYKFYNTINGPVVWGDDEILFFHQYGPLQDYVDADPQFFAKAFDFLKESLIQHADNAINSLTENIPGHDFVTQFNLTINAYENLRRFEHDHLNRVVGFPGNLPSA